MKITYHKVEELGKFYNKYKSILDTYRDHYEQTAYFLAQNFQNKEGKLLDVGCGGGALLHMLKLYGFKNLYGADVFLGNVESHSDPNFWGWGDIKTILKRLRANEIRVKRLSGKKLPYKNNFFDYLINTDVVEHLTDPYTFLLENKRILKKGSQIFCKIPNSHSIKNIKLFLLGHHPYVNFRDWFNNERVKIPYVAHIREVKMDELKTMLSEIGFDIIQTKYVSYEIKQKIATAIYPPFGHDCIVLAKK